MPGPQLHARGAACRAVEGRLPGVPIVWGGYFPSQHADVCLRDASRRLLHSRAGRARLRRADARARDGRLARRHSRAQPIATTAQSVTPRLAPLAPLDALPMWPYHRVDDAALLPSPLPRRSRRHASLVVRLSVRLQLLRGGRDRQSPLGCRSRRIAWARSCERFQTRLRRRRGAVSRHGLLHLRAAHGGDRRASARARA